MKLYLCQHGNAVAKEIDPDRPLSATGCHDVKRLANFFSPRLLSVSQIVHSGKSRARQTAELLAIACDSKGPIEARSGINPNDNPQIFVADLASQQSDLLLVGHLPFLTRLASYLLSGQKESELLIFHPGSIVCLERDEDDKWAVAWMIRPDMLPTDNANLISSMD